VCVWGHSSGAAEREREREAETTSDQALNNKCMPGAGGGLVGGGGTAGAAQGADATPPLSQSGAPQ
jgi:hypothetical protein